MGRFEEVSEDVQKLLDANMDQAPARRRAREVFKDIQLSIDHCLMKVPFDGLKITECYKVNSRGLNYFSKSWIPKDGEIKAVVCFCHGYGDTCTFLFEGVARTIALAGYGVFALDHQGFGLSDGLHGYISSFDELVDDAIQHFSTIKEKVEFIGRPSFVFGESMGGAVALKIHLKQPSEWSGGVLVAPMCKIADDMYPPWLLTQALIQIAKLLPKEKLVPNKDIADIAFRDKKKKDMTKYNIIAYKHRPRLRTALELLRTTQEIEQHLQDVSMPLLILHGKADKVTDPSVSQTLYEKAKSKDKKLMLYENAFHAILEGEPDDVISQVLTNIISWLHLHCPTP